MIVPMSKIRIVGPKPVLSHVIEVMHARGVVHIESNVPETDRAVDIPKLRRFVMEETALETRHTLESDLELVKKILLLLPLFPAQRGIETIYPDNWGKTLKGLRGHLGSMAERLEVIIRKRKQAEDELALFEKYEKVIRVIAPLVSSIPKSRDLDYVGLTFRSGDELVIRVLEDALNRVADGHFELLLKEVDLETIAGVLIFSKDKAGPIKSLLWEENVGEIRLPGSIADKPLNEALRIIPRKQSEIPKKIERMNLELAGLSHRWFAKLQSIRDWLENKLEEIIVSGSFYQTRMTFIVYGWLPKKELHHFRLHLEEMFMKAVVIEELPVEPSDQTRIPVALENPSLVRPFETFTRLLPLPRYGTVDPTPFIAFFFPLFFGFIIGDIGYGLILLLVSTAVRKWYRISRMMRDLTVILSLAAGSCILWGIAFGEFLGDLGELFGIQPLLMNRMDHFIENIYLGLAIGVIHILIGIGLGLWTVIRQGRRREAVAKCSAIVMIVAFLVMMVSLIGLLDRTFVSAALLVFVMSLVIMIMARGAPAVMQLHNLVNVLSYLRLVGIGIASAALASTANQMGSIVDNIALGILIGLVLHTINLVFAVVSPTIQSLRLHYVEFFENFFEGGGREYRPFRKQT